MRSIASLCMVILVLISLCTAFGSVGAISYDTVYVDDDGPSGGNHFTSLPTAYSAVSPGGTIHVAAGTYVLTSLLHISKDVAIIGAGRTVSSSRGLSIPLRSRSLTLHCTCTGAPSATRERASKSIVPTLAIMGHTCTRTPFTAPRGETPASAFTYPVIRPWSWSSPITTSMTT
jgi:hypothetical protein